MLRYLLSLLLLLLIFAGIASADDPPRKFPRGAKPSPRYKLQAAPPHRVVRAAPAQFCTIPKQLSVWMNDTYGCCVTSQEAFSKAVWSVQCGLPELFVPDAEVKRWAGKYGFLNGADLPEVMDVMKKDGFTVSGQNYKDGPYSGVDYSNEPILQNAIFTGPINIAIDADALPSTAGGSNGWYAIGSGRFPNTDHCVALCGYGPADFLYKSLGVPLPGALAGKTGYLLFTWSTIGFVDHNWLMSTCVEAWLRNPTTPGQGPPVPPVPPDPPEPPIPPIPGAITITLSGDLKAGTYQVGGSAITLDPKMTLEDLVKLIQRPKVPVEDKKPPKPPIVDKGGNDPTNPPPEKPVEKPAPEKPEEKPVKKSRPAVGEEVDGKRVGWGPGVPFPPGMEKYERDGFTQRIHRTSPADPQISKAPLELLEEKFRVSGGMEGIEGWKSTKYRLFPKPPIDQVALLDLSDGVKSPGLTRAYANGTRFDDVLTNEEGRVFEHRSRTLTGEKWTNAILYRDPDARPKGYDDLGIKACQKCHRESGTGGVGEPLKPGGREVFSDALAWNLLRR